MTSERKVVVITGASRGIGAQLSKAYRHIGYQVIASSRSMRKSDDPAILVIEGDITRPETAERILGIAAERFGRIDTLVNNAGVEPGGKAGPKSRRHASARCLRPRSSGRT